MLIFSLSLLRLFFIIIGETGEYAHGAVLSCPSISSFTFMNLSWLMFEMVGLLSKSNLMKDPPSVAQPRFGTVHSAAWELCYRICYFPPHWWCCFSWSCWPPMPDREQGGHTTCQVKAVEVIKIYSTGGEILWQKSSSTRFNFSRVQFDSQEKKEKSGTVESLELSFGCILDLSRQQDDVR